MNGIFNVFFLYNLGPKCKSATCTSYYVQQKKKNKQKKKKHLNDRIS